MPTGMTPPPMLWPGVMAVASAVACQSTMPMRPSRNGFQFDLASTTTPKALLGMVLAVMTSPPAIALPPHPRTGH